MALLLKWKQIACDGRNVQLSIPCVQVMVVLLAVLVRTSVVDAQHVWEYLARNNTGLR